MDISRDFRNVVVERRSLGEILIGTAFVFVNVDEAVLVLWVGGSRDATAIVDVKEMHNGARVKVIVFSIIVTRTIGES